MITTYIGVGTNVEREQHALAAYQELLQLGENLLVSPVYECEPIGFSSQNFYNFVVAMRTEARLRSTQSGAFGSSGGSISPTRFIAVSEGMSLSRISNR